MVLQEKGYQYLITSMGFCINTPASVSTHEELAIFVVAGGWPAL